MIHSFNFLPNLVYQASDTTVRTAKVLLASAAVTILSIKISDAISSAHKEMKLRNTFDYQPPIPAKIVTIDQASTLEIKSHTELINSLDLFSKSEMENCLSRNSYNLRRFANKLDIFDYFYKQKDIKDACYIRNIDLRKNTLNGRCALATDKAPLVLAVLSNRQLIQNIHEDRILTIPVKVMDLGGNISMKYAKNPFEICRFLDETKAQFGRPVDHLLISAHGAPDEIAWEEGELSTKTRFPAGCFKALSPDATISLLSCTTGKSAVASYDSFLVKTPSNSWIRQEITLKSSIAQHFANEAKKTVFAPKSSITHHEFDLIKNANSSISTRFFQKLVHFDRANIRNMKAKWSALEAEDCTGTFFPEKNPIDETRIILDNGIKVYEEIVLKEKMI